jgi:nitronate monooxygenase
MGVAVSGWRLANSVSSAGQMGVISGTGVAVVLASALWKGDQGGHYRRALSAFPDPVAVQAILEKYFRLDPDDEPCPLPGMYTLKGVRKLNQLTVIANFAEVWLAKEGHDGVVGANYLEKTPIPNMSSMYGAMLAGVDAILMGAGMPFNIPGVLSAYAKHEEGDYPLEVIGAEVGENNRITFDPRATFDEACHWNPIPVPAFFPIVSSRVLGMAMLKRANGPVDGLIVEMPVAGGHNAPPRGVMTFDERGEPVYSERDYADPTKFAAFGVPFWMAGSYGSLEGLKKAQAAGAHGIQVGTAFAYCDESGFTPEIKQQVLEQVQQGMLRVRTDAHASPTGFPFKVVDVKGTLADPDVLEARPKICNIGYLRVVYKKEDGKLGFRCAAEPDDDYVKKGGDLEKTKNCVCLCNALAVAVGVKVGKRKNYQELPIVTSGDALATVAMFLPEGQTHYHASDVLDVLLGRRAPRPAVEFKLLSR